MLKEIAIVAAGVALGYIVASIVLKKFGGSLGMWEESYEEA